MYLIVTLLFPHDTEIKENTQQFGHQKHAISIVNLKTKLKDPRALKVTKE
jgi:hypothetical protein